MKKILLVIVTVLFACSYSFAQEQNTKETLLLQTQLLQERLGRLQAEYVLANIDLKNIQTKLQELDKLEKIEKEKKDTNKEIQKKELK